MYIICIYLYAIDTRKIVRPAAWKILVRFQKRSRYRLENRTYVQLCRNCGGLEYLFTYLLASGIIYLS